MDATDTRSVTDDPNPPELPVFATAGKGGGVAAVRQAWHRAWRQNTDAGSIAMGEFDVLWSARPLNAEAFERLRPDQLVNCFPQMGLGGGADLCSKASLPRQLRRLAWQEDVDKDATSTNASAIEDFPATSVEGDVDTSRTPHVDESEDEVDLLEEGDIAVHMPEKTFHSWVIFDLLITLRERARES